MKSSQILVKEGIDMQEFENYGFYPLAGGYHYICPLGKTSSDLMQQLRLGVNAHIYRGNFIINKYSPLVRDKLFELLQAGLVEEVPTAELYIDETGAWKRKPKEEEE